MNRKNVTSTDVARRAGVSQSTVSMILNKKYNVSFSRETVMKVEEAARELGYSVEKKQRKTRIQMQGTIFVLCPNLTNPYYFSLLQGIEKMAKKNRYDVFLCNTGRDYRTEEKYLKKNRKIKSIRHHLYFYSKFSGTGSGNFRKDSGDPDWRERCGKGNGHGGTEQ